MYNRYILQNDGSYKRKAMPENLPGYKKSTEKSRQHVPDDKSADETNVPCVEEHPRKMQCKECQKNRERKYIPEINAGSFIKDLLPKDLDTGDLLIIVLLLLISADSSDDQGNALLTLALYFFK